MKNKRIIGPVNAPGKCVREDQLISPIPGFVPTHRRRSTLKHYVGATVFVDNLFDFTYAHLITEMNVASTVEAKELFEQLSHSYNVPIKYYHCDNGLFNSIFSNCLLKRQVKPSHSAV